ncbi:hypothetical protein [Thermococcus celericrescens]|uniref:hypothetical protein n=1 Tax=Thermococcus celericrescens TaxID=227598 RepID=UPI0012EE8815|nr:hypothetical protein [Thermococcus celericrescens]
MFIIIFVTLFAYNRGYLPTALSLGGKVDKSQLQDNAQLIISQLKIKGDWNALKSKTVSLSTSNGATTCTVDGTSYSGTRPGTIDYSTDGKTLEEIYNDCMDGEAGACEVIICALGTE